MSGLINRCVSHPRLLLIFICLVETAIVNAQNFAWAKRIGGSGATVGAAFNGIHMDAGGNLYCQLNLDGTADFNPGNGVNTLSSANGSGVVMKLDPQGNFVWAKSIPGNIVTDASGNIYTTGDLSGTMNFDPNGGVFNLTSYGYRDVFVAKYDASGGLLWAKQVGGAWDEQSGSIALSPAGALYLSGYFGYDGHPDAGITADFDPDPNVVYNLTTVGGKDGFILALDPNGQFVSVKQFGTAADESVGNLACDGNGNLAYLISNGNLIIEKSDLSYNVLWSNNLGAGGALNFAPFSFDQQGNLLLSGGYSGTVDFNPGAGSSTFTASTVQDPFVEKWDLAGNFAWVKVLKANGFAYGVEADATGNVYSAGRFYANGNVDFDPGSGTYNLKTSNVQAMYLEKLNAAGNFLWAKEIGGAAKTFAAGQCIALTSAGEIYSAIQFSGTVDFDPGSATYSIKSVGTKDVVIQKMVESIVAPGTVRGELMQPSQQKVFNIYPNPVHSQFNIELPTETTNVLVNVYDATGRLVVIKQAANDNRRIISMNRNANGAGVYWVQVKANGKTYTSKILVE